MYNILLSFLKPQIAFGGESSGGGGGGGGSRADRKGAQAILTTPTAPTPVITHNDNNRRDPAPLYGSNVYDVADIYTPPTPAPVIFDDNDYTPTSAELNAQLADLGAANMTDDYSIVDYSTTASGNPFIPAAIADSDRGGYMAPIGQNTQSEALIGQATDIGGGVYDPINILQTDAYQLGTGNAIMPPVNPVYDPLDDSNAFTSRNPTNAFDTANIYSKPVVDTYDPLDNDFVDRNPTNAFDVANIYANDELATSVYDEPQDEYDFVPRQGPVQAAPPPPGDEMDFVPMQGPSPMPGFFEGDVDSGTFSNTNSIDSNFYDEIPNDFSNFLTPGNDSGMEMDLSAPDANFYDEIAFQRDPIDDILAGEEFTTSAANVPASIPVQTADDGYFQRVPDQYDLAASESNRFIPDETLASMDFDQSSRFEGYDTSPSVIRDLALGTDTDTVTDTGTAIPTSEEISSTVEEIAPTTGNVSTYTDPATGQKEQFESYGQVNRFGVYAGDGFEWYENPSVTNPNGDPVLSRRYTGKGEGNGLGTEPISATEISHGNQQDREKFKRIGQISMDEGSEFASTQGSANDGDFLEFLKTGKFGASKSFADQYGFDDYDPTLTYGDSEISSSNKSSLENTLELADKADIKDEILPDFVDSGITPSQQSINDMKLYGQFGQQPNAAEYAQMTQVMNRLGETPMTKEFQDEIADQMRSDGASEADIAKYRKSSPVGEDINPFYDTFGEAEGFAEKAGSAIRSLLNFGVKSLTYGLLDPAKMSKNQAEKYMEALQETGTYSYDDSNVLKGVLDAEGNTVKGFNDFKNTKAGAVSFNDLTNESSNRDNNRCPAGYVYDVAEQMCVPIIDDGSGDGSSSPNLELGERPIRPPSTQPNRPPVVRPPSGGTGAAGVNFRKPKFFQDGGSVTPNIDSFLSGLR